MVWASRRARSRSLLLAVAAIALVASAGPRCAAAAPPPASARSLLLRLPDLQIGYVSLFGECARIRTSRSDPRRLASFIERYRPVGCSSFYVRGFEVPGAGGPDPPGVGTGALPTGSARETGAAWSVAPLLLGQLTGEKRLEEVAPPATIGEATRMFHWLENPFGTDLSTFLVWRSGNALAVVYVAAGSTADNDRDALALARRQQIHLETSTPYTAAESDDRDVSLDDPELKVPVHWLGLGFRAAGELPSSHLLSAYWTHGSSRRPAPQEVELTYSHRLTLDSWTSAGFRRHLAVTPAARRLRTSSCTTAGTVSLPAARVVVYAGYRGSPSTCPGRRPDAYRADAHLDDGTVVQINPLAPPYEPPPPFGERPATANVPAPRRPAPAYDSRRGVLAIARSLTLRVPRAPRGAPAP